MIEAIVLDWDGTVMDTAPWQHEFFKYCCGKHGKAYPYDSAEQMLENFEEPFMGMYERFGFNWENDKEAITDDLYEFFKKNRPEPFEGISKVLSNLNGGRKLGIATSNKMAIVTTALNDMGLAKIFSSVACFDYDKHRPKPAPDILNECLYHLGVKPENAVYVGDQPSDIKTARAAGCKAAAVKWGFCSRRIERLEAENPDYLLNIPKELVML